MVLAPEPAAAKGALQCLQRRTTRSVRPSFTPNSPLLVTEISLITPPVGLNVYVFSSVLPDVSTTTIFRGIIVFITVDLLRLALFVAVPWISLVLPQLFYG